MCITNKSPQRGLIFLHFFNEIIILPIDIIAERSIIVVSRGGDVMDTAHPYVCEMTLRVGLDPNRPACASCPMLVDDAYSRGRKRCFATMEVIFDTNVMGTMCPLNHVESEETENVSDVSESES